MMTFGFTTASTAMLLSDCGHNPGINKASWPATDFSRCLVPIDEISSGGPGKDGIPAIDMVRTIPVAENTTLTPDEPVISLELNGQARAWPLRVLIWHEIANDTLGGVPLAATYCPLCNAAIVFDRRLEGEVLDFGTTGNLRRSDLVMYDRQTESWWQQYTGEAIIGAKAGARLTILPSRLESWSSFAARHPGGTVLVPTDPSARHYGANPYRGYDSASFPFLYDGEVPEGIAPLARVVVVEGKAWSLDLIKSRRQLETGDIIISWSPGQNSALDHVEISKGHDIGTVTVQRKKNGTLADAVYDVTFAFVFHAFTPGGVIVTQ
ncbi:MAG: DUF3179 domain-containing protein [Alphaproteobacteria bacterium]|nr:DUF3179 domain-containing protein [Alphaproteobacteria bacterium]